MSDHRTHITVKAIPRVCPTTPPQAMDTKAVQLSAAIALLQRCSLCLSNAANLPRMEALRYSERINAEIQSFINASKS